MPTRRAVLAGCVVGCLGALLSGCATKPPDAAGGWTTGRLALRVEGTTDRGPQSLSAAFELRGDGHAGELKLLSPLGSQVASARWGAGVALLTTGDGERRFANLDALSREALGEPLPLAALPDWLAGRPWRDAPHLLRDDGFEQLGWVVTTAALSEGQVMARRAAVPAVTLRVRLDNPAPP